jgi:hypothetical protein
METYEGEWVGGTGDIEQPYPAVPVQMNPAMPAGVVQTRTPFVTATQGIKPRDMAVVERKVLRQAALMGDEAFYGWGAGKGRVEGANIKLAMVMINAYGNAAIVAEPVQETPEAWYFTHWFVDLETGVSVPRQWRESKRSRVDGNLDNERKDAIRFNRGQSKNIRNVILANMPPGLVAKAIEEAKKGSRDAIEKFIKERGIATAQTALVNKLKRYGVSEEQILEKVGKAEIRGLDLDDLVLLSADAKAIESGEEHASSLFPSKESGAKVDLKDKLKAKLGSRDEPVAKADSEAQLLQKMPVKLGHEPFSWQVADGPNIYTVKGDEGHKACDCGAEHCLHILAVERYIAQEG